MNEKEERIKRKTFEMIVDTLTSSAWPAGKTSDRGPGIVRGCWSLIKLLDRAQCFDDRFGESGSLEVDLAREAMKREGVGIEICRDMLLSGMDTVLSHIFETVESLESMNLLSKADKKRSRAIELLKKRQEEIERKAQEAKAAENARREKELEERKAKMAAAEKRLEEIRKMKEGV